MEGDGGCGCGPRGAPKMVVVVSPTTGGQLEVSVCPSESVEQLKKRLSKRLKVPKERICLLHRDRQLREGSLEENQLVDGSRLTLLPSVETGLLAQRPEQSVMQALESLNDSQVNDFLSGKAPLNLTMRLGDHMMLIQLQLSTVTPSSGRSPHSSPSHSSSSARRRSEPSSTTASARKECCCEPRVPKASASSTPAPVPPPAAPTAAPAATPAPATAAPTSGGTGHSLDTRALAEASRNLTQTLKQLSSEVLTSRAAPTTPADEEKKRQGAIIESMHHHGKGVYSGTFSGTLNPALQDKFGRPKRDISTIIHILNDLLCATPQYRGASRRHPTASTNTHHDHSHHQSDKNDGEGALTQENLATRGKMEQLRLIMEERRARRRARREARAAPYWGAGPSSAGGEGVSPSTPAASPQRACAATASIAASASPDDPMDTAEELLSPEAVLA